jgi:hypothetical protein
VPGLGASVSLASAVASARSAASSDSPRRGSCATQPGKAARGVRNHPPLPQDSIRARAFPLAQPPFRRDGRRFGPHGQSVAQLAWRVCPAPRRGRPPARRRRPARRLPGAGRRLLGPLEGMRNAKNPARSSLHRAYPHVRHLSRQDRLERYPRSIAEGPALLRVSGVLLGERSTRPHRAARRTRRPLERLGGVRSSRSGRRRSSTPRTRPTRQRRCRAGPVRRSCGAAC